MIRSVVATLLGAVLLVVLAAPVAHAEEATGAEVRRLAAAAPDDPAALARLRRIDRVDGRRVDLAAAVSGSDAAVRARLQALSGGGSPTPPADATAQARRILAGPDFRRHHPPRPLRGPLRWVSRRLEPVFGPVGRYFDRLDLEGWVLTVVAVLVVLAAAVAGMVVAGRRSLAVADGGEGGRGRAGRESPDALEREAERAEAAGDHERALRLRFRAGLLRLDAAGVLRYRPSLTTGGVTRQVRSPTLRELAVTVDEVVYGGRPADAGDVEEARRRWPAVLAEARQR